MTKIERLRANGFTVIHLAKNVYLVSKHPKFFKGRNGWTIMTIENAKAYF